MNQKTIFEIFVQSNDPANHEDGYLGPKSRFVGYSSYIKSNDWRKKRKYALEYLGKQCQRCEVKDKNLEVHHKHYKTLYHEKIEDIEVLCSECHEKADETRKKTNIERAYNSAFGTWAIKKYGEHSLYDMAEERLYEEFEEWLDWKEIER